jgi:hypothetical protein
MDRWMFFLIRAIITKKMDHVLFHATSLSFPGNSENNNLINQKEINIISEKISNTQKMVDPSI